MKQVQAGPVQLALADAGAPPGLELRHLRYFVTVADVGSFTHAAERMFIAQPTLSQQIRRLEEIVGTPLLQRRRDGLRLTTAGTVLLDASRDVLSLVDHGMSRTRQAAGLGRQRLRVVMPPGLPETLDAGRQHPKAAPTPRPGNIGSVGMAPQDVPDLCFQDSPAGDDAALSRGGRAETGGGSTRAPVLVRFVFANPLHRPGHAYLAVCRNKPVQHGSRPRIGRQLSTLVALAVGKEDQPSPQAAQHHQTG
jgi:DNA-binding transcriptional LysR family regulator